MATTAEGRRYRFGPLERRGLIAGWRGGQIAAVATGLVLGVLALRSRPSVLTVVAAAVAVAGGVAFAWWPIAGRTAEEWLPTAARWAHSGPGVRQRRQVVGVREVAALSGSGRRGLPDGRGGRPGRPSALGPGAGPFARLVLLSTVPDRGRATGCPPRAGGGAAPVGVVLDRSQRTYTATLELRGHSFALLGARDKDRQVASWAAVMASLARERSVLHRLQWIASTVPDDGAAVGTYLEQRATLEPESPARRSYADLLASAGAATCRHDVYLTVQVRDVGAAARAVRAAGGGEAGACAVLLHELDSLRRHLLDADISVERVLDGRSLTVLIRRAAAATPLAAAATPLAAATPTAAGWGGAWPWPLAVHEEWSCLRTDGTWHSTFWIAEWPRVDVGPDFLGPLLLSSVRRTVALVMEPVSPSRAVRQAEQARTADRADEELRRRGGFLSTARRVREAEVAGRREEELADGHAAFRFSGFVTVTATSREALASTCDATEQAAAQCRIDLRRLYGDQLRAYVATLPVGVGLS